MTKTVAVVDGVSISAQEVESAAAEALTQLEFRRTQFEIEMKRERESALENALDRILTSRVLAVEAAKRRITIDELLEIEVNSAAPPPSDEAVVQFYHTNKAAFEGSLLDHTASIRNYLRDGHRQEVLDKFLKDLKKSYHAVSLAEPPRTTIPLQGRPSKGPGLCTGNARRVFRFRMPVLPRTLSHTPADNGGIQTQASDRLSPVPPGIHAPTRAQGRRGFSLCIRTGQILADARCDIH